MVIPTFILSGKRLNKLMAILSQRISFQSRFVGVLPNRPTRKYVWVARNTAELTYLGRLENERKERTALFCWKIM